MLKVNAALEAAPEQASAADLPQRYEVHLPSTNRRRSSESDGIDVIVAAEAEPSAGARRPRIVIRFRSRSSMSSVVPAVPCICRAPQSPACSVDGDTRRLMRCPMTRNA